MRQKYYYHFHFLDRKLRNNCYNIPSRVSRTSKTRSRVLKNGSMLKVGRTARELHLHVLRHVPEWRAVVALQ